MTEIEDRLRDAFRADAQTVRAETLRPFERPAGSRVNVARRGRMVVPLVAALAVAVIAFGTVLVVPRILHSGHRPTTKSTAFRYSNTLLTVTASRGRYSGRYLVRYPVVTLQLRSIRNGRVIAVLLHSLGNIEAVMTRAGNVIAVEEYGCKSVVLRIDPRTDRTTVIRTLPQQTQNVALSPDGRELAYATYPASHPQPCGPVRQPTKPVLTQPNPGPFTPIARSVLAIVNLDSGAVVSAASGSSQPWQGQVDEPAWSPDGSMITVVYSGEVLLLSASHPDFATARRITPPRHCSYLTSTWTRTGLLAVLGCGPNAFQSPSTLVQLTTAGQRTSTWPLPACSDFINLFTDPTARHVLLEAFIEHIVRPCRLPHPVSTIRVMMVGPASLDSVAVFPSDEFNITGW